jgi:hypothetical protein
MDTISICVVLMHGDGCDLIGLPDSRCIGEWHLRAARVANFSIQNLRLQQKKFLPWQGLAENNFTIFLQCL